MTPRVHTYASLPGKLDLVGSLRVFSFVDLSGAESFPKPQRKLDSVLLVSGVGTRTSRNAVPFAWLNKAAVSRRCDRG
jgi:hypothetical protein